MGSGWESTWGVKIEKRDRRCAYVIDSGRTSRWRGKWRGSTSHFCQSSLWSILEAYRERSVVPLLLQTLFHSSHLRVSAHCCHSDIRTTPQNISWTAYSLVTSTMVLSERAMVNRAQQEVMKRRAPTESNVSLDIVSLFLGVWVVPGSILQLRLCYFFSKIVLASLPSYPVGN